MESVGLPETLSRIIEICYEAASTRSRRLVLLTGVPGAGKTLVGLQLAHDERLEVLRTPRPGKKNGGAPCCVPIWEWALVQVLQDALGSTVFVAGMKKFIDYYLFCRPDVVPPLHVAIFDEAQRAWDEQQMASKHEQSAMSEPLALLRIVERILDWCVVLALVGEGQEIHKGEEAGLSGWAEAAKELSQQWVMHGPIHRKEHLSGCAVKLIPEPLLNLSSTLRSHVAGALHLWVGGLLDQKLDPTALSQLAEELRVLGFPIYVVRDLELARLAIAQPCLGSSEIVLRISRSRVPCTRSLGLPIL